MTEKSEFTKEIGDVILKALAMAPPSQLSAKLKKEAISFKNRIYSSQELYEFCHYVSKQPENDASPFVKTLCDVTSYFKKPA